MKRQVLGRKASASAIVDEGNNVVFGLTESHKRPEDPDVSKEWRVCLAVGRETDDEAVKDHDV